VVDALDLDERQIEAASARAAQEIERREQALRGGSPPPDVRGRTAIVVDDGLATGSTMRAALAVLRSQEPAELVVAVPVAPAATCADLEREADEVVCLVSPNEFHSVGAWYDDFG